MADNTLVPGTLLKGGKYKIERVLGQGTFGITYLASCNVEVEGQLGKMNVDINVAVKEFFMADINRRLGGSTAVEGSTGQLFADYRKKFRREAEHLASLRHPNIVQVLDVFDDNNTVYYVMQYIDGGSLDAYIQSRGCLPEAKVKTIAANIADALHYMHSRHMLHLDLKPANIMLDREGKVHLIDFGLSKQYGTDGLPESSTSIGAGTPGYAPLEQSAHTDNTFQPSIDVYALGATMYKMLTGQRPPEASTILNDGFPRPLLLQHGVSAWMADIIEKAMSPQRRNRYADTEDLLLALTSNSDIIADIADGPTRISIPAPVYGPPPVEREIEADAPDVYGPLPIATEVKPDPSMVYGPPPVDADGRQAAARGGGSQADRSKATFKGSETIKKKSSLPMVFLVTTIALVVMICLGIRTCGGRTARAFAASDSDSVALDYTDTAALDTTADSFYDYE